VSAAATIVMPPRIAALRRDRHGRPVPWFVADVDGVPDFRVIGAGKIDDALQLDICWICGGRRTRLQTFVIGPMCAINRTSAEPPSHSLCGRYAALACPFLTTPRMRRRENGLPPGVRDPAGVMLRRNPGVTLVWTTARFDVWFPDPEAGPLIRIGEPVKAEWFCEGRPATRLEVATSIGTGLPELREMALQDGPDAVAELDMQVRRTVSLLPEV
jgi:hypothetical protein